MLQLQAYAACDDEVIREHVQRGLRAARPHIREITGADEDELNEFLSLGMWLNVQAAMGVRISTPRATGSGRASDLAARQRGPPARHEAKSIARGSAADRRRQSAPVVAAVSPVLTRSGTRPA